MSNLKKKNTKNHSTAISNTPRVVRWFHTQTDLLFLPPYAPNLGKYWASIPLPLMAHTNTPRFAFAPWSHRPTTIHAWSAPRNEEISLLVTARHCRPAIIVVKSNSKKKSDRNVETVEMRQKRNRTLFHPIFNPGGRKAVSPVVAVCDGKS